MIPHAPANGERTSKKFEMMKLADYLQRAAECRDLARTAASPNYRAELETMAVTWESLAEMRKQRLDRKAGFDADDN
jgi:hypothetical protein